MSDFKVNQKNNQIVEITLSKFPDAHINLQQVAEQEFCVISTYVPNDYRGQGIGKKLYQAMLSFVRERKAKFFATCPFIVDIAKRDETIKDIYISKF